MNIFLYVEVAGCPTVCRHCWAQGTSYPRMPFDDVRWTLETCKRWCDARGFGFSSGPMHEVVAHPRAPEVIKLFRELGGCSADDFNPVPTTGVPVALREDWREFLRAFRENGTKTFWVAFHGLGTAHDRLVSRDGAFEETCVAVRRIKEAGYRCGTNAFVTQDLIKVLPEFLGRMQSLGLDEFSYEIGRYSPLVRLKNYESQRPTRNELSDVADSIAKATGFWKDRWKALDWYTESAWRKRAVEGEAMEWQSSANKLTEITFVCRPNLDLYSGKAGLYGRRHGNLRADGAEAVLRYAVEAGPFFEDEYFFKTDCLPDVGELAQSVGDAQSEKIYFDAASIRYLWLTRWANSRQTVMA